MVNIEDDEDKQTEVNLMSKLCTDLITRRNAEAYEALQRSAQRFQEAPYPLDAILESCVSGLSNAALQAPVGGEWLLRAIYTLSIVRGYKTVAQYFPTDLHVLPKLLDICGQKWHWQARYSLLLWLSILVLIPFKLELLGETASEQLFAIGTKYIGSPGKEREGASLLLARLVSRDWTSPTLQRLEDWLVQHQSTDTFTKLGLLETLAVLARSAPRAHAGRILALQSSLHSKTDSDLQRKLLIKIKGRLALKHDEYLETAVSTCFERLQDPNFGVRYSSAKYLARSVESLRISNNADFVDDIVGELFARFDQNVVPDPVRRLERVSEAHWSGLLLALAEIIRVVYVPDVNQVAAILEDALHFEQHHLNYSGGNQVRDTACYVCWSLFRVAPQLPDSVIGALYDSLIGLSCFDREASVRRAAAAALQEGLGRHGGMASTSSLELLQQLDFANLGRASRCYLEIAPIINPKPKLEYLVHHGVLSKDPEIRRLAAESLALLKYDYETTIDSLLALTKTRMDEDVTHGVALALGKVYKPSHNLELIEKLLGSMNDFNSPYNCEGILRLLTPLVNSGIDYFSSMIEALKLDDAFLVQAGQDLMRAIPSISRIIAVQKMVPFLDKSPSFVACVAAVPEGKEVLNLAAKLEDTKSRQLAIEGLDIDKTPQAVDIVLSALDDYAYDARGDIGSWVREAAVQRVFEWYELLDSAQKDAALSKLWRLAAEPLDKIRQISSQALSTLLDLTFGSLPTKYFESLLLNARNSKNVADGYIKSLGAKRATPDTLAGSLSGMLAFLKETRDETILRLMLDRCKKGAARGCLLRGLARLSDANYIVESATDRVYAIAYNGTFSSNLQWVLPSIRILVGLTEMDKRATMRLAKLCGHSSSIIRRAASEALFESGIESEILEATDWMLKGYKEAAESLVLELQASCKL